MNHFEYSAMMQHRDPTARQRLNSFEEYQDIQPTDLRRDFNIVNRDNNSQTQYMNQLDSKNRFLNFLIDCNRNKVKSDPIASTTKSLGSFSISRPQSPDSSSQVNDDPSSPLLTPSMFNEKFKIGSLSLSEAGTSTPVIKPDNNSQSFFNFPSPQHDLPRINGHVHNNINTLNSNKNKQSVENILNSSISHLQNLAYPWTRPQGYSPPDLINFDYDKQRPSTSLKPSEEQSLNNSHSSFNGQGSLIAIGNHTSDSAFSLEKSINKESLQESLTDNMSSTSEVSIHRKLDNETDDESDVSMSKSFQEENLYQGKPTKSNRREVHPDSSPGCNPLAGFLGIPPKSIPGMTEPRLNPIVPRADLDSTLNLNHMHRTGELHGDTEPLTSEMIIARAITAARGGRKPRSEKRPIPSNLKDIRYYERRKRNNAAAKKSRDARKKRENEIANKATLLETENAFLKNELLTLKAQYEFLSSDLLRRGFPLIGLLNMNNFLKAIDEKED